MASRTPRKLKRGRPAKDPKKSLTLRMRPATLDRYRRFIGPETILQEAIERAMRREMEEAGFQ
jgi:hypothetical protein